jgi:hypothetical protein
VKVVSAGAEVDVVAAADNPKLTVEAAALQNRKASETE